MRGSTDGFTSKVFHKLCDNKGPTLTIIESTNERIFGGFTNVPWDKKSIDSVVQDIGAFLFSVDHFDFHYSDTSPGRWAVTHDKNTLAHFGAGIPDLQIYSDCNINSNSISEFGYNYKPPQDMKLRSKEAREYFAGSYKF